VEEAAGLLTETPSDDGRHLGCSGTRSSSRGSVRGGPIPSDNRSGGSRGATATAVANARLVRKRRPIRRRCTSTPSRTAPRTSDTRCPRQVTGWGKAPARAIAAGGAGARRSSSTPAPGPTNLGWLWFWPGGAGNRAVASPAIRSSSPISQGSQAGEKCCVTGDRAAVLRSSDERGRARGSYRLQKSTSGAWPLEPVSEEFADHSGGSSSSARERGRREEASEAGSLAAKPRDRWRALTQQRSAKAPAGEHSSMKGALIREDRSH